MIDRSGSRPASREMAEAILKKASHTELRSILKREYALEKLEFRLDVAIYSKSQFPFWAQSSVNGVEFAMPLWLRVTLRNWTLDFVDNRFLLRNGDKARHTLNP